MTAFFPGDVTVGRLNGDGFCGIRNASTVAAFRTAEGGAWVVDKAITDASFFAAVTNADGSVWLFAVNARSFDWGGAEVFNSTAPATVEVIFARDPAHKTLLLHVSGAKGTVKTPDGTTLDIDGANAAHRMPTVSAGLRPKLSLFSDDSAGDMLTTELAPSLELVRLPLLLRGAYRVEVEVNGPKGSRATAMLGTSGASLDPSDKLKSIRSFSGSFSGLVTLTVLLHGGCKLKSITVERELLPNGGLESWNGNLPEGFKSAEDITRTWRETVDIAEGEASLGVQLAAAKKGSVRCSFPLQGRTLNASAKVLMRGASRTDMRSWLSLRFLDEQGKQLGKEVVGKDSRAGLEWAPLSVTAIIPAKATKAELALFVETNTGEGKAFFDDIRAGE
jgi:hypothetical protein